MTLSDLNSRIATQLEELIKEVVSSLQSSDKIAETAKRVIANVWKNNNGQITGSASVWTSNDLAEDALDGVVTTNLLPNSLSIQVDVCKSSGHIVKDLFKERISFETDDQLLEIIRNRQVLIRQLLISALEEALRLDTEKTG